MTFRTAFITGASSGIGAALAARLAAHGVEVALAARRAPELEALAAQIGGAGGRARVYPLAVTNPAEVERTLLAADDELGGIDLVVANAGVSTQRWAGKLTFADCARTIDVNVTGAAATLVALLPRMVERGRGHLCGVSSLAQYRGLPRSAAYSASKAFLSTFLEGIRVDLRSTPVCVTDVRPGFVKTPILEGATHPMPFLVPVERAAEIIHRALDSQDAVVAFPWQLATLARSTRMLPAAVYDLAVTRARGR